MRFDMNEIVCIGTYHMKKDGGKKLLEILEAEKPDVIAVEGTDIFELRKMKKKSQELIDTLHSFLKENGREDLLEYENEAFKCSGFEHSASKGYAYKNRKPLWYIDDKKKYNSIIKKVLSIIEHHFPEVIPNLESLKSNEEYIKELFKSVELSYSQSTTSRVLEEELDFAYNINLFTRDEKMKENILKLTRVYPEKKIIVITGGLHLISDLKERTLYSKLRKHNEILLKRIPCF